MRLTMTTEDPNPPDADAEQCAGLREVGGTWLTGWDGKSPIDRHGNPADPEKFSVVVIDSAVKE